MDLAGATQYWPRDRAPRRDQVLALLAQAVSWEAAEALVRPFYESDIRRRGRRGYSLRMMLRILAAQWLWNASDRDMENALIDSKSLARFTGIDPWAPRPPSASAIRAFRNLCERETAEDGALSVAWNLHQLFRSGIRTAGLEHRHGQISEPIFRRSQSPLVAAPIDEIKA